MLLIGFAATVLAILTPQAQPDFEALLAPAKTPNEVAAFCFAPANRRPGERDRDCQYRVLAEEAQRIERIDGLRRRCAGQADGSTDACVIQILTAEHAAAEAAKAERAERARRGDDLFGDLFSVTDPAPEPPARPSAPYTPPRPNCRSEIVPNADGTGGSTVWVCGNNDALSDQVRDRLLPR